MIKLIAMICIMLTSPIFSVSFAETIYCPSAINGKIYNYDDQWKLIALHNEYTPHKGYLYTASYSFKPPSTLQRIPLYNFEGNKTKTVTTMNFTFNQGIGIETYGPSSSNSSSTTTIKLLCKATYYTAIEQGVSGILFKYSDRDIQGSITAEKTITNYSTCTVSPTVSGAFNCF